MTKTEILLARCLTALENGETVESCLARYPDERDELAPLLRAAQIARAAPTVVPSADFQEGARDRMVRMIREREASKSPARREKRHGFLEWLWPSGGFSRPVRRSALATVAALIGLLIITISGVGVVYASSDSVPGDSLYPVKLAAERLRLAVSLTESEELRLRLRFASERLEEASELAASERGAEIEPLMQQYAAELKAANGILRRRRDRQSDPVSASPLIRYALDQQQAQLKAIQDRVSDEAQPAVDRALEASEQTEREALELEHFPTGTPSISPGLSPTATRTRSPSRTPSPKAETGPEDQGPTDTPPMPGRTKTPEAPGLTATPHPPGLTRTPVPARPTGTPTEPEVEDTPLPPGLTRTPRGRQPTITPGPPESDPSGPSNTPQAPDPGPPDSGNAPGPPDPDPPGQGEGPAHPDPDPPGLDNNQNTSGDSNHPGSEDTSQTPDPPNPGPPVQAESPDQP